MFEYELSLFQNPFPNPLLTYVLPLHDDYNVINDSVF
jgi:hypothetical protein